MNTTLQTGGTYENFTTSIRGLGGRLFRMGSKQRKMVLNTDMAKEMAGWRKPRHRHLELCPALVAFGLMLAMLATAYELGMQVSYEDIYKLHGFTKALWCTSWWLMDLLACTSCGPHYQDAHQQVTSQLPEFWARTVPLEAHNVVKQALGVTHPAFGISADSGAGEVSMALQDKEQLRLWRDGVSLLEAARRKSFIKSWLITRGTLMFALRFGANRPVRLPSGHLSAPQSNFDFDVVVQTDDWSRFHVFITAMAQRELGFDWCGWQEGWSESSVMCLRGRGELDIAILHHERNRSLVRLMEPTVPCYAETAFSLEHRLALHGKSTVALWDEDADWVELRCPRDPLSWMGAVWRHKPFRLLCLALPIERDGSRPPLTEEDIVFIWDRGQELLRRGFLSMAAIFGQCHEHPQAEIAQLLYKRQKSMQTG